MLRVRSFRRLAMDGIFPGSFRKKHPGDWLIRMDGMAIVSLSPFPFIKLVCFREKYRDRSDPARPVVFFALAFCHRSLPFDPLGSCMGFGWQDVGSHSNNWNHCR